jgi:hypothetical protein
MLGDTSNLTTNPNKLENVVKFARDHKVASDAAESSLKQLAQYWNGIEYTNDTGKDLLSVSYFLERLYNKFLVVCKMEKRYIPILA